MIEVLRKSIELESLRRGGVQKKTNIIITGEVTIYHPWMQIVIRRTKSSTSTISHRQQTPNHPMTSLAYASIMFQLWESSNHPTYEIKEN